MTSSCMGYIPNVSVIQISSVYLATGMTRLSVNVELEELVLVQETSSRFVNLKRWMHFVRLHSLIRFTKQLSLYCLFKTYFYEHLP